MPARDLLVANGVPLGTRCLAGLSAVRRGKGATIGTIPTFVIFRISDPPVTLITITSIDTTRTTGPSHPIGTTAPIHLTIISRTTDASGVHVIIPTTGTTGPRPHPGSGYDDSPDGG